MKGRLSEKQETEQAISGITIIGIWELVTQGMIIVHVLQQRPVEEDDDDFDEELMKWAIEESKMYHVRVSRTLETLN